MPLQLYARCDLRATSTRKGVMPVPRHWHPGSFFLDSSVARWNDNKEHMVMQEVYFLPLINSKAFFKSMLSISAFLPKATFVLSHFI